MKVWKFSTQEKKKIKKRKKLLFFVSADKKCITVEEGKEVLVADFGIIITNPFKHFVEMVPKKGCCYALYDASYEIKESRKEELMGFLLLLPPELAPLRIRSMRDPKMQSKRNVKV